MARSRDLSKVLSSSTALATDAEIAATYQTQAGTGLRKIIPTSVAVGSGTGSADSLGTVSFSGASSVSVNGCFSSTYRNYRLLFTIKASGDVDVNFRLRASGTDLTSSNYYEGRYYIGGNASLAAGNNNQSLQTFWTMNSFGTWQGMSVMDICNPQTAEVTHSFQNTSGRYFQTLAQSLNNITTSYDGFTFYAVTSPTLTGNVTIYGYN